MNEDTQRSPTLDFAEQHRRYLLECMRRREHALAVLPPQLLQAGVAAVIAGYSGSGDSGQFDEITYYTAASADISDTLAKELRDQVETLLYDTLEARHGGWENNDGAEGEFQWTLATNHFAHTHRSFYTECDTTEHEGFDDLVTDLPEEKAL